MSEKKVAAEVAEAEFNRFVEAMGLDVDPKDWTDEDKQSFKEAKRKIIGAMESGHLTIDEDGQPVYRPQIGKTDPITFYEPIGSDLMAIDQAKKGANVSAAYKMLAAMTKTNAQLFSQMKNRDLKVCQALQALFLG